MIGRLFIAVFILGGLISNASAAGAGNPMESLLKEQIAKQRYQKTQKVKKVSVPKKVRKKKNLKEPAYQVRLIAGVGKKLVAHVVSGKNRLQRVRVGSILRQGGRVFKVTWMNERCIVLRADGKRYEIPLFTGS